jgi:hypothetical protein
MTAIELLVTLQRQGFNLTPLPEGKLAVKPAEKLTDSLREALRQRKVEVLALITQVQAPSWPCPHCGNPAEIEAIEPSADGQRVLTFWHCEPCQVWAVTPNTLREPPSGWVSRREQ